MAFNMRRHLELVDQVDKRCSMFVSRILSLSPSLSFSLSHPRLAILLLAATCHRQSYLASKKKKRNYNEKQKRKNYKNRFPFDKSHYSCAFLMRLFG